MFTNTVAGIQAVEPSTLESARGMGLTEREVLTGVELPLSTPLIMEGVRIAFVQVIATATLGALVAWGGLGRFIVDGFARQDMGRLIVGAVLVGMLAIAAELGLSAMQRATTPRGMQAGPLAGIAETLYGLPGRALVERQGLFHNLEKEIPMRKPFRCRAVGAILGLAARGHGLWIG